VRPVKGALAAAMLAARQERRGIIVPADNAAEAAVVESLEVLAVNFVSDAVGFLTDELPIEPTVVDLEEAFAVAGRYDVDFSDPEVHRDRQESAKRAMTVAAAGHHNPGPPGTGPPGSGKTAYAGLHFFPRGCRTVSGGKIWR